MQLMPATGRPWTSATSTRSRPNIHAGVKYIRFMVDPYFAKAPMDRLNKGLFAFASYNAGPGRDASSSGTREEARPGSQRLVQQRRDRAVGKIGRETVQYVSNIYKYYVAYTLIAEDEEAERKTLEELRRRTP